MKYLLSLLETQNLPFNRCYRNYEIYEDSILIKKSKDLFSSAIKTKELVDLYNAFGQLENVEFELLENEDISIKKIKE